MARKHKRNEDNAPPAPEEQPEEEDELEEEGEVDPGAGGGAARLKLEATRKRKCEYMQCKRARDGEEEKAKSKLTMRNFRNGLSGQAKVDYLARQNQYKAVHRQRKTEGAGPAPRGRRIEDNSEQEDEPEDEGAEARYVHMLLAPVTRPPTDLGKRSAAAAAREFARAEFARAEEDEPASKACRSKKPANVRGKRKPSAEGDMLDAPTTKEETEYHSPPPLNMSLQERPAPPQPASPASSQPTSPAPSQPAVPAPSQPASPAPSQPAAPTSSTSQPATRRRKYHSVLCARGPRCRMGNGGRIPIKEPRAKHFTLRKWGPRRGNPFLIERGHEPGILDAYLTEDEGPEPEERSAEWEQNAGSIDLDPDGFILLPYLLPSDSPAPFGLQGMKEEDWDSDGFFDPEEPPRCVVHPPTITSTNFHTVALTPPKAFDSIIPTLASRAATPTFGDIYTRPSRSPSPFPVSPERNALTPLLELMGIS
ncbi:hypothetical protein C8F04DRAFT_1195801 [Mycena alexandri]|uniref:Uncharacterized protein n=1 Tax=Mycena alexandri TaxID=1745969 RepID=A0AAD6S583_9AGAR|nr:hypothetical protein C8F04DRAFT_1195801 [Mycena alexandri]